MENNITPNETRVQKKSFQWLIVIVGILLLGVILFFVYENIKLKQQLNQSQLKQNSLPVISPLPTIANSVPTLNISPTVSPAKLFLIKLELKSLSNLPPLAIGPQSEFNNLADYLNNVIGLPKKTLTQLYYDTRSSNPYGSNEAPYQSKFYINFNQSIVLKDLYQDQYINLAIAPSNENLLPYLIKSDYCQQDSDCIIGSDMCTNGAFNYYRLYRDPPWGCGPGGYKNNFSWFKWGEHDDKLNCEVELKFDGAKCVNNQCSESNYQKICTNTGNP